MITTHHELRANADRLAAVPDGRLSGAQSLSVEELLPHASASERRRHGRPPTREITPDRRVGRRLDTGGGAIETTVEMACERSCTTSVAHRMSATRVSANSVRIFQRVASETAGLFLTLGFSG